MFGLKADWSLDIKERYFTLDNYCGPEPRCVGTRTKFPSFGFRV